MGTLDDSPGLTDEAKAEIAAAVKIVAEDKSSQRLRAIHEHLIPPSPENDPPKDGEPSAPPKKEEPPKDEKPKRGLWQVGNTDES